MKKHDSALPLPSPAPQPAVRSLQESDQDPEQLTAVDSTKTENEPVAKQGTVLNPLRPGGIGE